MKKIFFSLAFLLISTILIFSFSSFATKVADEEEDDYQEVIVPPATAFTINGKDYEGTSSGYKVLICPGSGHPCKVRIDFGGWSYYYSGEKYGLWPDVVLTNN